MTVRAFARVREIMGTGETAIETAPGSLVCDVWQMLVGRYEELRPFDSSIRFARNGNVVSGEAPLSDGDEVALLPPVSGG